MKVKCIARECKLGNQLHNVNFVLLSATYSVQHTPQPKLLSHCDRHNYPFIFL